MGVIVCRYSATAPSAGTAPVTANDDGVLIGYGSPANISGWVPAYTFAVDAAEDKFFAIDTNNSLLKTSTLQWGADLDGFDYTAYPNFFTARPDPRMVSGGGYLICNGANEDTIYVMNTGSFGTDKYRWSLTSGSGWSIYDIKMSFDQQYFYIAGSDKRLYKLNVENLAEYADSGSLAAACEWVSGYMPEYIRTISLSPSGSSDIAVTYGIGSDASIGIARINSASGSTVWNAPHYGYKSCAPRWDLNRVYFANGYGSPSVGNDEASYLNGDSGSWDNVPEIKNHASTPSKTNFAHPSHNSDVFFHLGYSGANHARIWATNAEPFARRMAINNTNDAGIDAYGDPTGFYHQHYLGATEPNWANPSNPLTGSAPTGSGTYGYYTPVMTVTNPGTGNRLNVAWSGSVAVTGSEGMAPIDGFRLYRKPTNTIGGPHDPTARLIASYAGSGSVTGSFADTNVYNHQVYYYAGFYLYDTTQAASGSTMYEAPYGLLYMGTGSSTPLDTVPPDMVSGFVATAQDITAGPDPGSGEGTTRLAWTNPTGSYFTGAVVLRQRVSPNASVVFTSPADGTNYVKGQVVGDSIVIYSRPNLVEGGSVVFLDKDLSPKYQYHYAVYTHDRNFFYTSGSVVSPGVL